MKTSGRQVLTVGPDGSSSFVEYDAFGRQRLTISGLTSLDQLLRTEL